MNKEILYEILNSKSETLSSTEIENIMNEELDKSTQDMDTDLIDLCLEALNTVDEEKLNKRKKKYRFGKILIAVAILIVVVSISIPVCAKYLDVSVPEGIITIYKECFNIDISPNVYINDIIGTLEKDGINDAVLPKIVFEKNTLLSNYSCVNDSNTITSSFDFSNDDVIGKITIEKFNEFSFFSGKSETMSDFEHIKYINKNDIKIIVFSKENLSYINYSVNQIDYIIILHSNFDTACQIAKSI